MKKTLTILLILLASVTLKAQVILIQETFQDWKAEPGTAPIAPAKTFTGLPYTITKKLFDGKTEGTFSSNALIAAPNQSIGSSGAAEGNGSPSKGRIALRGKATYLQLPQLTSIGQVNIKAYAGTDQREFKLQVSTGGAFEDIPGTVTACTKTVTKLFTFNINYSTPATLRIVPTSNSSIFIYDLEVLSNSTKK